MLKHVCLVGLILTGLILFASGKGAQAEALRIAYDDFPPLTYQEDDQPAGEAIDLIRKACANLGIEPVFLYRPFARSLMEAESGEIDCMTTAIWTQERAKFLYYPKEGIYRDEIIAYAHKSQNWSALSMELLKMLKVGAVRGYNYGDALEKLGPGVTLVKDSGTLFKMFAEKRFNAILNYRLSGEYYLKRFGLDEKEVSSLFLKAVPYYTVFSKKLGKRGAELADRMFREMKRIRDIEDGLRKE